MRTVLVSYSKDNGRTWSSWKQRSLGELGNYVKQVRLGPFGQARSFRFKIRVTDPVRRDLIGMMVNREVRE